MLGRAMGNVVLLANSTELTISNGNANIIEYLEEALERARSGEIAAFGLVAVLSDGTVATSFNDDVQHAALVGGAYHLLNRIAGS